MPTLLNRLARLETSMLADINKAIRAMDAGIRRVNPGRKLLGRARTASCRNDFLTVMRVLADAQEGDVLLIDGRGGNLALAGEMFAMEAARKKLGGIIVDGGVRDSAAMQSIDLPVYARFVHPVAGTIQQVGAIQVPVSCGGVVVHPGDIVFGDADGVICGTDAELAALLDGAASVMANEEKAFAAFKAGTGLMDMLNFEEHYAARAAGKPSDLKYTL
ncbi:MAG: RraA family protein [Anderseniella sp.]|nr:RraA family protein [Anderseniella sp.]